MRLRTVLALAAVLGVSLLSGLASAHGGVKHGFTVTSQFVDVPAGPGSSQSIRLWASLFKPNAVDVRRPAPVVLMSHGWGGRHTKGSELAFSEFLADRGYVVLAWDSRGFGDSEGWVELNSPDYEVQDARTMISLAAALPYVIKDRPGDPRAGMIGGSYGGGIQLLTAAFDDRLDAIAPFITWNDLGRSLAPNGVIKSHWVSLLFAAGAGSGLVGDFPPGAGSHLPDGTVNPVLAEQFANAVATGQFNNGALQALAYRSPATHMKRIKTPALIIQGQADTLFSWNEGLANYRGIRANGVPARLVQAGFGHGTATPAGEITYTGGRDDVVGSSVLSWFAKYLRRQKVDTGPEILVRRSWVLADAKDAYAPFQAMRAFPTSLRSLGLDAAGKTLGTAKPGTAMIAQAGTSTSYSEVANFSDSGGYGDKPPVDAPGTAVAFDGAPLTAPTTVLGVPSVTFGLTSTTTDTTVFVKLLDVAPDGTARLIKRTVMPARLQTNPAGVPARVSIELTGIAHRFEKGHRIRLVVASSDFAFFGSRLPGVYTIHTGGATGARLVLPVA